MGQDDNKKESKGDSVHEEGREDVVVDTNAMWNTLYEIKHALNPILKNRGQNMNSICPKSKADSCPKGYEMKKCEPEGAGFKCKECEQDQYQPNENWWMDKCRLKQLCMKKNMYEKDPGSATRNSECSCLPGYHLPSPDDPYKCLQNPTCPKGKAPGEFGGCESCLEKNMYSDTVDSVKSCKPLTNCEKQDRCIKVHSDGTYDNTCGPKVSDLKTCKEIEGQSVTSEMAIIAIPVVAGIIGILLFIFLILFLVRRKKYKTHYCSKKLLTPQEYAELRQKIIKTSDKDPAFCKKVMTTACSFVPERIGRQIWDLPRELFRSHPISGKYEQIVEKYKESQPKNTVTGYLSEWRDWRGDNRDAIFELFRCLGQVKRDNIVEEICSCLQNDIEIRSGEPPETSYPAVKNSFKDECMFIYFPCCYDKKDKSAPTPRSSNVVVVEADPGEAGTKLLAYPSDEVDDGGSDGGVSGNKMSVPGTVYRNHPSPSAPELDSLPSNLPPSGFPKQNEVKFTNRQLSVPVQATS